MIVHPDHIDRLITRFLAGEASHEEQSGLEHWMAASEANRKYFEGIRTIHEQAISSHKLIKVDVDKAWEKLKIGMMEIDKTKEIQPEPVKTIVFSSVAFLRIAAVMLLLAVITSLIIYFTGSDRLPGQMLAVASKDSIVNYVLSDKSSIVLNKNSTIEYAENYGSKSREVKLRGEAYFDVKHDAEKPFIVHAEETMIKDIGTAFNVKSIPGSDSIEITVTDGKVLFCTADNPGIELLAGEKGTYSRSARLFKKESFKNSNEIAYKTKVFVFHETTLADVVASLNAVYTEKLEVSNPVLLNCTITVSFDNEDFRSIVGIIAETLDLQIENKGIVFILNGKGCDAQEEEVQ